MRSTSFITGAAFALAIAAPAFAADDPMAAYYGNTFVCKAEGHFECHEWYNKDGTVQSFSYEIDKDGKFTVTGKEGTYKISGAPGSYTLCTTWKGEKEMCRQNFKPMTKVGDSFSVDHKEGRFAGITENFSLVAGHK